uniref:Lipocalin-like TiLipo33 allele n=1 Tax=Triatoma infestans TaxID=30076 RepID=A6YPS0_TRIIF|nr:lipocalin-like TiLipo33 allele [Triatoma infestans]
MKMIIAVTFLGIVTIAFAQECQLMQPAANFDAPTYFSIPHVYVTHSKNEPKTDVCREYDTSKTDGGSTTVITSYYKIKGQAVNNKVTCTSTGLKNGQTGQFSVVCQPPTGTAVTLTTSVLATDNQNYAILQRCPTSGQGNILVLQTTKEGVNTRVTDFFKKQSWNIHSWISRTKVNCENIES